jgi:hypothetical protein
MLIYEELTNEIYAAAIEVHKELGPGLLERFNVAPMKDGITQLVL